MLGIRFEVWGKNAAGQTLPISPYWGSLSSEEAAENFARLLAEGKVNNTDLPSWVEQTVVVEIARGPRRCFSISKEKKDAGTPL